MRKWFIRTSMQAVLGFLAFFARRPALTPISNLLTRSLAKIAIRAKGIGTARTIEELGPLWQRSFPAKKHVPLESVDAHTVIAQIHTPCPLRGTGDVDGCYRMMEYDRKIVDRAGGQFVVLESQATPGRTCCRVAMRLKGESMDDLKPAHETARR